MVSERRERRWEKLSPLSCLSYAGDDLWDESFVFFFRVLFVEDTVLLISQADAAEAGRTIKTAVAIDHIASAPDGRIPEAVCELAAGDCFVVELTVDIVYDRIHTVAHAVADDTVSAVLHVRALKASMTV